MPASNVSYIMLDLFVPEGTEPGDVLGVVLQKNRQKKRWSEMIFVMVPKGMIPGSAFERRLVTSRGRARRGRRGWPC